MSDLQPILYRSDSAAASSGAPIFNDQWEVVALHHAGVPRTDFDGNYLTQDGRIWDESMPVSTLAWAAQEGVRTSRIVSLIEEMHLPGASDLFGQDPW